jgi:NO-binding membrane sensor protein with MHYT domain
MYDGFIQKLYQFLTTGLQTNDKELASMTFLLCMTMLFHGMEHITQVSKSNSWMLHNLLYPTAFNFGLFIQAILFLAMKIFAYKGTSNGEKW